MILEVVDVFFGEKSVFLVEFEGRVFVFHFGCLCKNFILIFTKEIDLEFKIFTCLSETNQFPRVLKSET